MLTKPHLLTPSPFFPALGGEGSGRMLGVVEQGGHVKSRGHDGRTVVGREGWVREGEEGGCTIGCEKGGQGTD